jgi:hypothetical protein
MKAIPEKEHKEIVAAARIAMSRPEQEGFWDKLADFFEKDQAKTESVIQPREMKEL